MQHSLTDMGEPADDPAFSPAKLRIIDVAETLFAQRSIDSVSLREIAAASGNGNNNAVQYHFGNKDNLIQAIFDRRVAQMEGIRRKWLDEARQNGTIDDLETLMRILCLPLVALKNAHGDHTYASFMNQYNLRHRPAGIRHTADRVNAASTGIRELMERIYRAIGADWFAGDDYQVSIAYLLFCNMLVLSDSEKFAQVSPDAFAQRVEATVMMATNALRS